MPTRTLLERGATVQGAPALRVLARAVAYDAACICTCFIRSAEIVGQPPVAAEVIACGVVARVGTARRAAFSLPPHASLRAIFVRDVPTVRHRV